MTQPPAPPDGPPPPGGYYPPPGGYYPPPGGYYPPPGATFGAPGFGALPRHAYTSWITRVAAYIIDSLPVVVLAGIGQVLMLVTAENDCVRERMDGGYSVYCNSQPTGLGFVLALVFGLAALAFAVWNYGYRQGTTGSSIGKSVMKFKVVGERTGQPIGFGPSVLRQLAHVLDTLVCYLGYLWPLWDAKRQTFADKIMSTVCLPA